MTDPRLLLVSLRDPHDPMAEHERACVARVCRVSEARIALLPILSGPMHASDLMGTDAVFLGGSGAYSVLDPHPWRQDALDAVSRVIDSRLPAWASCFGFQGVAMALGAEVVHDPSRAEMGGITLALTDAGRSDDLTRLLPEQFWVQTGHQDHVDTLPDGLVRLAAGGNGAEQLARVDGAPFYASQFHPELDVAAIIHRFRFYASHYDGGDPAAFHARLEALQASPDTPEIVDLLSSLVRAGPG